MSSDVLLEELEVLESIYPTELSKLSERDIQIEAEPDDLVDGAENLKVSLDVHYIDEYPDALPDLSLKSLDDNIDQEELNDLLTALRRVGEENLGMAMTFTLVSHLRELLSDLVRSKAEKLRREQMEKERIELEAEEARTRGTPVTVESFKEWKAQFDKVLAKKKAQDEEEKTKGLTPKEREEFKRLSTRLSGRQLFERNKGLEEDSLLEEDAISVDFSQYERTREEEIEEEGVTFSDSD
ncbi:RWD domain-containing protein [Crucibulum laeve]|uniref:RWD domain-containing protein n=1 Tax=Crucibulum laeve TaxID=68775 RepID=A0A5C3MD91_9AGAR|nr:RWD domain-containing protein [Crucibulum laeve]